jgi:hypothetical protein
MTYRLSRNGRMRKRAHIRKTKPWLRSTRPRTEAGKRRSSQNALKLGMRSAATLAGLRRFRTAARLFDLDEALQAMSDLLKGASPPD